MIHGIGDCMILTDITLFQTITHPSTDVEITLGELFGCCRCLLPFSWSEELDGVLAIHVTSELCPLKLPISSPVLEEIAWMSDLNLHVKERRKCYYFWSYDKRIKSISFQQHFSLTYPDATKRIPRSSTNKGLHSWRFPETGAILILWLLSCTVISVTLVIFCT